jgi:hypothetical protein
MNRKQKTNIPNKNIIIYSIYLGILLLFTLLILVPDYIRIQEMNADIEKLKEKTREQEKLSDLYKSYQEEFEKLEKYNYYDYPREKNTSQCNVLELIEKIEKMCEQNQFCIQRMRAAPPDMRDRIKIELRISGDFRNLHSLMIALGKQDCVERFGGLHIRTDENTNGQCPPRNNFEKNIILDIFLFPLKS